MDEPVLIIDLPENATKADVLHAAALAKSHADQLHREVWRWRNMSEKLFDKADEMKDD